MSANNQFSEKEKNQTSIQAQEDIDETFKQESRNLKQEQQANSEDEFVGTLTPSDNKSFGSAAVVKTGE